MLTRMVYNVYAFLFCRYPLLQGIQKEKNLPVHTEVVTLFPDKGLHHHNHTRTTIFYSLLEGVNNAWIIKTAHLQADFAFYVQAPGADLYSSHCSTHRGGKCTENNYLHETMGIVSNHNLKPK